MVEEQAPPPRRTLGDYVMHQGLRHFFSILPATTRALEMKPSFLILISTHQFTTMDNEDPYTHLATFYELVGTMGFQSADIENGYMHLFPFSLAGKAKEWLNNGKDERKSFCKYFFQYIKAKFGISMFRQGPDEAFSETWERVKMMLRKCPKH